MVRRLGMAGLLVLAAICLWLAGCGRQEPVRQTVLVMDTVATLTATGPEAQAAVTEGVQRLRELDAMASPAGEDSDLAKLAAAAGNGQWVRLHPEVYHMLAVSQQYSERSGGAWDVTAGPLVKLWGIGTDNARVPSAQEIAAARAKVGWQNLELEPASQSARLKEPGMSLDLGGIAKGYALDEVRRIYAQHGIQDGLINLGASSLYALGRNDKGQPWRIGLRDPRGADKEARLAVVPLADAALSTSGDYERYFEQDGVRYHHIIDPRTGAPAQNMAMSATIVVAGSLEDAGLLSDLLTTTVFVLGPEQGQAFLAELPAEVQGMICDKQYRLWAAHDFTGCLQELQLNKIDK
ncbi:thiamine biosynthesis lipoprotein [Selenomonas sp. GACV-9]|uniref:FAD:protein FMN transferase n=1 Tax=Selenomonas sp. GACV-9 TaxID=3158782 RepID=UPI0008EC9718|nr:thiamine biosynthesis lipoprotein [Selenomonas ruminantium]